MNKQFNPNLLLLARQYRRMSQMEVAKSASVNQGHYSRIENGLTADSPPKEVVDRISHVLGFPLEFFYQEDGLAGLPLSVHPMHRRKASISEGVLKGVHAELNVRLIHLRRYFRAMEIEPELPLPQLDVDDEGGPQEIARKLRTAWSVPDGPIRDLIVFCERAGILVVECDFDAPIDGVTMLVRDLPPCVFLNKNVTADRMRFSLAHELGHVIMHRFPSDGIEEEANLFAGEFLVPEKAFRRLMVGQRLSLEWLARQKSYWRVSMQFLLYRAQSLGLATRHQAEYLWKRISALGWRTREPEETNITPERSTVFPMLVRHHADSLGYGVDELKSLLNFSDEDIRQLYGVYLGQQRLFVVK